MHNARWPVSEELRPKQRRQLVTADDVLPEILRTYPDVIDGLNACPACSWRGKGRPGPGWDDWLHLRIPLGTTISLPCHGEA
jgi:hypothetical protein